MLVTLYRLSDKIHKTYPTLNLLDMCNLTGSITDYHNVAQGKTSIPGVDDGEECELTDVRKKQPKNTKFDHSVDMIGSENFIE